MPIMQIREILINYIKSLYSETTVPNETKLDCFYLVQFNTRMALIGHYCFILSQNRNRITLSSFKVVSGSIALN
jgi:hypothetical protein